MKFKTKVKNTLLEAVTELVIDSLNDKMAEFEAAVVPKTPVGKSIRGRTEKNRLVKLGRARTRKGYTGGRLRKGWRVRPARVKGNTVVGKVYNNVHYAAHVNFGHRTRQGTGKSENYRPKPNGKKYVEGQHFIERALEEIGIDPRLMNKNYKK